MVFPRRLVEQLLVSEFSSRYLKSYLAIEMDKTMRNGYRVLDTDCHQMEPVQIWKDYMDPGFADRAPASGDMGNGRTGLMVETTTQLLAGISMHSSSDKPRSVASLATFARSRTPQAGSRDRSISSNDSLLGAVCFPSRRKGRVYHCRHDHRQRR